MLGMLKLLQVYLFHLRLASMNIRIESSWKSELTTEFAKPYFKTLTDYVRAAYQNGIIYPAAKTYLGLLSSHLLPIPKWSF